MAEAKVDTRTDDSLSPKEAALIELLDDQVRSQRSIAGESGFSLGMTNLLLKRLVGKGYIKIVTLNGRTLKYMLTPRGFAEKLRRSYTYLLTSIRQLNDLKASVQDLAREKNLEHRPVLVLGRNELAELARETLREEDIEAEIISPETLGEKMDSLEGGVIMQCLPEPADDLPMGANWEIIRLDELIHSNGRP